MRKSDTWEKAYRAVWLREEKFLRRYAEPGRNGLKRKLEEWVPEKLMETLHAAFVKAFGLVFEKGTGVIASAGRLEERQRTFQVNAYAAELREDRKTLRVFSREAAKAGRGNVLLSGAGDAVIMDRTRRYAAIKYEKRFLLRRRLERD